MGKGHLFYTYLLAAISIVVGVFAPSAHAVEYSEGHRGYLSSVEDERYELSKEVVIIPQAQDDTPTLHDRIFTEKLTNDFTVRYEARFGRTQGQQFQAIPSRFFDKELKPGEYVTEEEYVEEQRDFGNYMSKRLVEFHVDNYMRSTPSTKNIYKIKETVSNMTVKTKSGYKVRFKYSISGNSLETNVENPYEIEAKMTFYKVERMGSSDQRTLSSLGYNFTKTLKFVTDYATEDSRFSMSAIKRLKAGWSTSLTGSKSSIEDKIILGLAWRD